MTLLEHEKDTNFVKEDKCVWGVYIIIIIPVFDNDLWFSTYSNRPQCSSLISMATVEVNQSNIDNLLHGVPLLHISFECKGNSFHLAAPLQTVWPPLS